MPKSTPRAKRVADLIHHELANILIKEINDPRLKDFSLTTVQVSPDLKQAKVFYTTLNEKNLADIKKALLKAAGYLRRLLAGSTELRYIPELRFIHDQSIERGARISSLIDKAIEEDRRRHPDEQNNKSEQSQ